MKLIRCHLRNFRVHADTEINFRDGITAILGDNESGKSTILEALEYALFGGRAVRGKVGGIRWAMAGPRETASVEWVLEVAGGRYRVTRTEREARVHDGTQVVAHGHDGVTEFMTDRLGMSHEEFLASYMCRQKDVDRLSAMKPGARHAFIRSVLGVGRLDRAVEKCRAEKNGLRRLRDGMAQGLGDRSPLEENLGTLQTSLRAVDLGPLRHAVKGAEATVAAAQERVDRHTALAAKSVRLKDKVARSRAEVANLDLRIRGLKAYQRDRAELAREEREDAANDGERAELAERLIVHERARDGLAERRVLLQRLPRLEADADTLEREIFAARLEVERFDESSLHRLYDEQQAAARAVEKERDARIKSLKEATEEKGRWDERLANTRRIRDEGICAACGRPFDEGVDPAATDRRIEQQRGWQARWAERIAELSEETDREGELAVAEHAAATKLRQAREKARRIRRLADRTKGKEARLARVRDERQEIDQALAVTEGVEYDADAHKRDRERATALAATRRRLQDLRARLGDGSDDERQLRALETRRELREKEAADAEAEQKALGSSPAKLDAVRAERHAARQDLHRYELALARAEQERESLSAAVDRAREALADYDERAETLRTATREHGLHVAAEEQLAGFRQKVVADIRPELEALTSGFVDLLTDGRHEAVLLDKDFTPVLMESGAEARVVSGGTQDVTAMGLRLAISQMIAQRSGAPLGLFVLDEPFGALDVTRRQTMLALLRDLTDVFPQILIISHIEDTREGAAVDRVIELRFDVGTGRTFVHEGAA